MTTILSQWQIQRYSLYLKQKEEGTGLRWQGKTGPLLFEKRGTIEIQTYHSEVGLKLRGALSLDQPMYTVIFFFLRKAQLKLDHK